ACINVGRYCLWAKTQVGPIPRIPFVVHDVQDPVLEEGCWG
ncbi:8093_t:CDS:1, partial [Paraglomus occultum]